MECEALLYPISTSVKVAANSGFTAALRQIAGQARSHNCGGLTTIVTRFDKHAKSYTAIF